MGSNLEDEARFWLARSLIAAGPLRYEDATAHLIESLAREDLARRWKAKLHLAQAELDVKRQAWDDATKIGNPPPVPPPPGPPPPPMPAPVPPPEKPPRG